MTSKIWIYNHWGELEEGGIPISTTPRGYVLNGYGRCDFAVSYDDTYLMKEKLLRHGNFVHIRHIPAEYTAERTSIGVLPDWTGIITGQVWNKDAVVISAVSAEAVLAFRAMPFAKVEGSPDVVFRQIVAYATRNEQVKNGSVPMYMGRVDVPASSLLRLSTEFGQQQYASVTYSDELRTNAFDHIKKMTGVVGMDWDVTAAFLPESGALRLKANLYNRKGREGLILTTVNTDEQNPLLTIQGTIMNHIFSYNQAQTEQTRIMQEIAIQGSIDKYGPFQTNMILSGVTDAEGMVQRAAQTKANQRGEPVSKVSRTALDVMDTFSYIDSGNICFISDPRAGFNPDGSRGFRSWARILSADYNDLTNKVALNVELMARSVDFPNVEDIFI
jgi:hypothetical protein